MNLSQLETFISVVKEGGFAAAARKLGISPAAISKQIATLEKDLGVQLLIRTTRNVELSEIGKAYYSQCLRIQEEVEEADALIAESKVVPKGKLKVFSTPQFAEVYILPRLASFLETYSAIEFTLEVGERMPNFDYEEIDVMLGASAAAPLDILQKKIATTDYAICASPSYLKRFGTPKTPEDLLNHCCLSHSGRKPPNEFYLQKGVQKYTPYLSVNDTKILAELVLRGVGIVQLHHYVVRKEIEEGKLIPILASFTRKNIPIYYFLPPRKFTPSKVTQFIRHFCDFAL